MQPIERGIFRVNWAFRNDRHTWGEGALVELTSDEAAHINACSPGVLSPSEPPAVAAAEPESRDIAEAPNDRMVSEPRQRRGRTGGKASR